ncbi:hypothetical protein [Curtobacterium sp. ISL-83]|uniref:hypothetical protein n=1 Tax=Curtobacterium sp. ISL-83 TaxID=2819145 RepID=UPI001BEBC351|nr:hypothetical protein [Curtobacterium sp. ISL-83]MBT2503306.1 hypothetical protein [Curtobacterium sp. ISL-83]
MSLFVARCFLVTGAVLSVLVGVFAPIADAGRLALIAAGAGCAVLDVVLARSSVDGADDPPVPVLARAVPAEATAQTAGPAGPVGTAGPAGTSGPGGTGSPATLGALGAASAGAAGEAVGSDHTAPGSLVPSRALVPGHALVLGHGIVRGQVGGPPEVVGVHERHVLVVGQGALAQAVFTAVAEQVRRAAGRDDIVRRVGPPGDHVRAGPIARGRGDGCAGDGARSVGSARAGGTAVVPDGVAVAVRLRSTGEPITTVVLVPGLGSAPSRWDVAIEVSRYGCLVRRPGRDRRDHGSTGRHHDRRDGTTCADRLPGSDGSDGSDRSGAALASADRTVPTLIAPVLPLVRVSGG